MAGRASRSNSVKGASENGQSDASVPTPVGTIAAAAEMAPLASAEVDTSAVPVRQTRSTAKRASPATRTASTAKGQGATASARPAKRATATEGRKTPVRARKSAVGTAADAAVEPEKLPKVKKPASKKLKLIRDSFTFPESDFALIAEIKRRALDSGREVKKSEVLRAGLMALAAMSSQNLHVILDRVERIKTGRPAK
ncbi:hypothetical protein [Niveibacterium microcysteis]|uniref:Uncharacterized protein n=1 Tax=Niveibacterium microcysteis TaxID=2811415 RepID=A0ABX7MCW6_9RHOO|nr:hypothetical protein [Niveibacterium microcysteis]QSI78604.1 hypothetical protein JY500_08365 [Niveibacterium microcysteis]